MRRCSTTTLLSGATFAAAATLFGAACAPAAEDAAPSTVSQAAAVPGPAPEAAAQARRDLDDLFFVLQAFSYQGDYVRECPSLERIGETLMKLEEDLLLERGRYAAPLGPRRVDLRLGPPINVADHLGGHARTAVPTLTAELESRIKSLLDAIGPGSRREVIPDSFQEPPRS